MRPQPTRRGHSDMRQYEDRTWYGVGVGYGVMMLVLAVIWAVSYPVVATIVFALIAGALVAIWVGARFIRRQAQRTICVPGMDICFSV